MFSLLCFKRDYLTCALSVCKHLNERVANPRPTDTPIFPPDLNTFSPPFLGLRDADWGSASKKIVSFPSSSSPLFLALLNFSRGTSWGRKRKPSLPPTHGKLSTTGELFFPSSGSVYKMYKHEERLKERLEHPNAGLRLSERAPPPPVSPIRNA